MRRVVVLGLRAAGCISLLLAALAGTGFLSALLDRWRYGRGIMFADAEILGALAFLLGLGAGGLFLVARSVRRSAVPEADLVDEGRTGEDPGRRH